jgi:hypothetical protein
VSTPIIISYHNVKQLSGFNPIRSGLISESRNIGNMRSVYLVKLINSRKMKYVNLAKLINSGHIR